MFTGLPLSDGRDNLQRRSAAKIDECEPKCFRYFKLNYVIKIETTSILANLITLQVSFDSHKAGKNGIDIFREISSFN